jgi:hypothetical protein
MGNARIVTAANGQKFLVEGTKVTPIVELHSVAVEEVAAPAKAASKKPVAVPAPKVTISKRVYNTLKQGMVDAGMDASMIEVALGGYEVPVRVAGLGNRRAVRAAGTFLCPFFGQDFTAAGVHHLPQCGHDDNGGFTRQKQLDNHVKWASEKPRVDL